MRDVLMRKIASPLASHKRLEWIDAARGFSIFGIFMVNVPAFHAPFFLYGGGELYWSSELDRIIQSFIDIFFQASFYTLFSFLFGFGMQIIVERLTRKQLKANIYLLRRFLVLIGFGLIHAFFIWHGDILLSYGIIGLLLFFFFKRVNKTLCYWAFCLLLLPNLLYTGLLYLVRGKLDLVDQTAIDLAFKNYGSGSLVSIWQQNYQDWIYANGILGFIFLSFNLLPLFLLGMFVARKRWLHDIDKHKVVLKKIWIITFILFILFKAVPYLFGNPMWFSLLQDSVGGPASAIFYLVSITLAFQRITLKKLLNPLTYVGRMSLSNYIFQSLFCFTLFYGGGLYGHISPWGSVVIVIGVFTLQIFISKWWMKHYRYGPLEWVWRRLTYLQPIENKKAGLSQIENK